MKTMADMSGWPSFTGIAKALGTGGLEGASEPLGALGNIRSALAATYQGLTGNKRPGMTANLKVLPVWKSNSNWMPPFQNAELVHQPQNQAESIAEQIGIFAPAAFAPGNPIQRLAQWIVPAIAPTVQDAMDKYNASPTSSLS